MFPVDFVLIRHVSLNPFLVARLKIFTQLYFQLMRADVASVGRVSNILTAVRRTYPLLFQEGSPDH